MCASDRKTTTPARRKRLVEQARKRRNQHQKQAEKHIREDRALTETAYRSQRRLSDNLKIATKFLGVTATLFIAGFHLYVLAMAGPHGGPSFVFILQGLLTVAGTALAFALAYLFILGMEAFFDNADQTRENLEVNRLVLAEMRFSGESLSEIAEAQVDEEAVAPPPPPPPPPKALPVAPPTAPPAAPRPEPPRPKAEDPAPRPKAEEQAPPEPDKPKGHAGDFLPLDDED